MPRNLNSSMTISIGFNDSPLFSRLRQMGTQLSNIKSNGSQINHCLARSMQTSFHHFPPK